MNFKKIITSFFLLLSLKALAQNKYDYPIDSKTNKVLYDSAVNIGDVSKERLFKRANAFIALQKFDRPANIKTKKKGIYDGVVVEKPIQFSDLEEGKIFGEGFVPFKYRRSHYFTLSFSYKIYVENNQYRYVFTDFVVHEYIHAGMELSKKKMMSYTGARKSFQSAADIRNYPLEKFMNRSAYDRSDDDFINAITELKGQLYKSMNGDI
ncbi:DUF4468 domain-containing protein [Chitinophaga sp. HK235]|uniref:DUF4468 domain-containing protein n=1 Tax=Chitinophaga sp. HK235 TaxID=2952571 RepID=UPI001BAAF8FE|nr:DUF4468 domain-containing protein [Chitinophaga sp. HK235]